MGKDCIVKMMLLLTWPKTFGQDSNIKVEEIPSDLEKNPGQSSSGCWVLLKALTEVLVIIIGHCSRASAIF